jgi:hypothetical protein
MWKSSGVKTQAATRRPKTPPGEVGAGVGRPRFGWDQGGEEMIGRPLQAQSLRRRHQPAGPRAAAGAAIAAAAAAPARSDRYLDRESGHH